MRANQNLEFSRPLEKGRKTTASLRAARGMRPMASHPRINRTLNLMVKNRNAQFGLTDLIAESGMSRRGFFKAFNKHAGITPGRLLRNSRIEKAKKLLIENDISLAEIAGRCGYQSVNSLWVAFRNATGMAPKRYQRLAWLGAYRSQSRQKSA